MVLNEPTIAQTVLFSVLADRSLIATIAHSSGVEVDGRPVLRDAAPRPQLINKPSGEFFCNRGCTGAPVHGPSPLAAAHHQRRRVVLVARDRQASLVA